MQMGLIKAHLSFKTRTRRIMKEPTLKRLVFILVLLIPLSTYAHSRKALSLSPLTLSPLTLFTDSMDLNNGVAGINPDDQLDFAVHMASDARNHYDYALWAFNSIMITADHDAVEGARAVLHLAIQEVNAADAEVRRIRCRRIRGNMRQLGRVYGRFTKVSKQHGANFRANLVSGILATRNQLLRELRTEFDALYWDFSSIDPGSLLRTYVDLEERDRLFEDRSIYWSTLADDVTKPWSAHI